MSKSSNGSRSSLVPSVMKIKVSTKIMAPVNLTLHVTVSVSRLACLKLFSKIMAPVNFVLYVTISVSRLACLKLFSKLMAPVNLVD